MPDFETSGRNPRLVERTGSWDTWWFCDLPDSGVRFRVVREEWHKTPDGQPVREIYEIEVTDPGS